MKKNRSKYEPSKSAEADFYKALKQVARASAGIVNTHVHGSEILRQDRMTAALKAYSEALGPWAERQAKKLLDSVNAKNKRAYQNRKAYLSDVKSPKTNKERVTAQQNMLTNSSEMAHSIRQNLANTNVDKVARELLTGQVNLIKSIPLEAGQRAQQLAYEAQVNGNRADEIAKELMRTSGVTESRAKLIAITETAKANASLNEARATAVGSTRYIWRNSGDGAVREAHRKYHGKNLDGMIFNWDSPPTLDDGTTGNPGNFPRCRCFAEAVFDD